MERAINSSVFCLNFLVAAGGAKIEKNSIRNGQVKRHYHNYKCPYLEKKYLILILGQNGLKQ
jgi:hypothetical protein